MKDNEGQEILNYITEEDIQSRAEELLSRRLSEDEIDTASDFILEKTDEIILEVLEEMTKNEDCPEQDLVGPSDF